MFNIHSQIKKELDEFFTQKVHIAGTSDNDGARYLQSKGKNYEFSQWETINLIDLYYNSKFESGEKDSENQRKLFLNICKFRSDVAAKQIDLDVKNFNFVPESGESVWGSWLMSKEFALWAKENYFGELINTCVENFPRYGWIVLKKVRNQLEFVPLQTLRNQQDAKSLATAKFVTIEHPDMTLADMEEMKGWDTSKLDMTPTDCVTVYERYGHVPLDIYKKHKGEKVGDNDHKKSIDCLVITTLDKKNDKGDGIVLFMEKISERPFVEAHWSKQHGRLMGIGEIENQFENQVGANMSFNLYRRQLLWSSKKIFQSPDEGIAKNLVRDVKDGDILQVSPNGNITQIDMGNRAGADFNNFSQILEKNSDQKSFTYEVATGEALPSGAPFRLGVLLSNAVSSHFDMKREKLGLFFKRAIIELVLPEWKKEVSKEHVVTIMNNEDGYEALKNIVLTQNIKRAAIKAITEGRLPDIAGLTQLYTETLEKSRHIFVKVLEDFYKDIEGKVILTIIGEEIDLPKKIETMTNLYTQMVQRGDPRADRVLGRILAYSGESYDLLVGANQPQQTPQIPQNGSTPSPIQQSSLNQPTTANQQV